MARLENDRAADPARAPLRGDLEVALAAALERDLHAPIADDAGNRVVFHGEGLAAFTLPALNPTLPGFVSQAETVVEPGSFIDYIVAYKSATAICRASLGQNSIVAVLDYHGRAREGEALAAVPGRCAHVVTLRCPFDADYDKWRRVFGKELDQQGLVTIIEDMIHTIGEPPAADLLEAVADLKIDRAVRFKSARNQRNGTIQFTYEEVEGERPAEGGVALPDELTIIVPIFQGGNPQALKARLRYRLEKGAVLFHLVVPGLDSLERLAFRSIGESVRESTATPVFYTA